MPIGLDRGRGDAPQARPRRPGRRDRAETSATFRALGSRGRPVGPKGWKPHRLETAQVRSLACALEVGTRRLGRIVGTWHTRSGRGRSISGSSRFRSSSSPRSRPTTSLQFLHKKDEGRISTSATACAARRVEYAELVRGYEYEKGQYVTLTDEDFKKVNPEATQSVEIVEFVDLDQINPMYFDTPYYLEPEKKGGTRTRCCASRSPAAKVGDREGRDPTEEHIAALKPQRRSAGARADALRRRDRRASDVRLSGPRESSRDRDQGREDADRHDERRRVRAGESSTTNTAKSVMTMIRRASPAKAMCRKRRRRRSAERRQPDGRARAEC